ncbi:MAG: amidohydrolase family protein [Planctomycetales bacterium]|nr:amidohydrolase family protein [Planctomycetales bacterium]
MDELIDVNVSLSRWPFRRLPGDETADLVARLRRNKITQAWAGSLDGLFHRDMGAVNERLATECRERGEGLLVPFGSINPMLPDWEDDLRRCHEVHQMPGIRLHPNYHGDKLDNPVFAKLLTAATERGLVVQIVLSMEDERTQHPLCQVSHVDTKPLAGVVKSVSGLRLVVLNVFRAIRIEQAAELAASGQVFFDIAMLESVAGVSKLVEKVGSQRVLFGSHFPLFVVESAVLKLRESVLAQPQLNDIRSKNARGLLVKQ